MDISRVASDFVPRFHSVETVFVVLAVFCTRWFSSGFFFWLVETFLLCYLKILKEHMLWTTYNVELIKYIVCDGLMEMKS